MLINQSAPPGAKIAVIGAIHLDRIAHAVVPILQDTSTPGSIEPKPGGVATNISRALARLQQAPALIGCLGADADGRFLMENLAQSGVDTAGINMLEDQRTGSYLALHQPDGELFAAIADSEITASIPLPSQHHLPAKLQDAQIWLCETNLEPSYLQALAACKGKRLLAADTVSIAKAPRLRPLLPYLDLLFTNKAEAAALLDLPQETGTEELASTLAAKGCGTVAITNSSKPLTLYAAGQLSNLPVLPANIVDVTGAGDAFIAGFLAAFASDNKDPHRAAYHGLTASAIAVEATGAAPTSLSQDAIQKRLADHISTLEQSL
ncbi:carbohydrate kinase family protein [Polycladidibacter hongkongensis]|uniref:carbohydrate kinase family protein n=1 Tax=Polycladidibacter hongkongensis TaxID=1647556 RepID=UPI00082B85A5|nr:PfkB family carbohydrate kinase [Pseudovibrio hongkongensis]